MDTLVIKPKNKAEKEFLLTMLQKMDIEVEELPEKKKKKRNKTVKSEEEVKRIQEEFLKDFEEALREVKLHKEGKIKLKTLEEVLNEL